MWLGGTVILYLRFLKRQRGYLRNFPPVDSVPLDTLGGNPFGAWSRAVFRAQLQRQPDAELERMRRDLLGHWRFVLLWGYGFPVLVIVMIFAVALLRYVAHGLHLLP